MFRGKQKEMEGKKVTKLPLNIKRDNFYIYLYIYIDISINIFTLLFFGICKIRNVQKKNPLKSNRSFCSTASDIVIKLEAYLFLNLGTVKYATFREKICKIVASLLLATAIVIKH